MIKAKIPTNNNNENNIKNESEKQKEAIVYCFFKNSTEIKNLLFEIEKIQKVLEENNDDKVAIVPNFVGASAPINFLLLLNH